MPRLVLRVFGLPLGSMYPFVLTRAVVYQYRCGAGDHIVRVGGIDCEVAHRVWRDPGVDRDNELDLAVVGMEPCPDRKVLSFGPPAGRVVPERVVPRRVQRGGLARGVL